MNTVKRIKFWFKVNRLNENVAALTQTKCGILIKPPEAFEHTHSRYCSPTTNCTCVLG